MAYILSIETATQVCSVAIHHDGALRSYAESHLKQSHSVKLVPMIDQVLKNAEMKLSHLNGIAISEGPGSYTGLRIGLATAKGLCFTHDLPLIGVSTLLGMANGLRPMVSTNTLLIPLIDARRMEAYGMVVNNKLEIVEDQKPFIFDNNSFGEYLEKYRVYFLGNGSDKLDGLINHSNANFIKNAHPSAKHLGDLALHKFRHNQIEDLAYFKPNYLKEFYTPKPPTQ